MTAPRNKIQVGVQHVWDKRVDEDIEAYEAFVIYRNLDPTDRSERRTADVRRVDLRAVRKWARQYEWQARAFRYDQWVRATGHSHHKQRLTDMNDVQLGIATQMLVRVNQALNEMKTSVMEPKDVVAWFKAACEIQRRALNADRVYRASSHARDEEDEEEPWWDRQEG